MKYQEFDVPPPFEHAAIRNRVVVKSSGLPRWSNGQQPPPIDEIVDVTINRIGLARVIGYFVESGYLGLLVKPIDPPAWFTAQNGFDATAHVFGAEIQIGDYAEPELNAPSQAQLAALQRFATRNGRRWKVMLLQAWGSGADEKETDGPLLRQVRNQFGSDWLCTACRIRP